MFFFWLIYNLYFLIKVGLLSWLNIFWVCYQCIEYNSGVIYIKCTCDVSKFTNNKRNKPYILLTTSFLISINEFAQVASIVINVTFIHWYPKCSRVWQYSVRCLSRRMGLSVIDGFLCPYSACMYLNTVLIEIDSLSQVLS